jgi:VIT1/CCC1 family predicted Fe2+/Mn2+ transporter
MEQERTLRRRRRSIAVGVTGIVLLFAAALGILATSVATIPLLVVMIAGLVLLVIAFLITPSRVSVFLEKPKT